MKTTVEIPDPVFRRAKAAAAEQGMSLKDFITDAVRDRLTKKVGPGAEPPWMKAFGGLRDLHRENKRIERIIEQEFEQIDEEEWH